MKICIVHTADVSQLEGIDGFDVVMNPSDIMTEVLTQDIALKTQLLSMYPEAKRRSGSMGYALITIEQPYGSVIDHMKRKFEVTDIVDLRLKPANP